MARLLLLFLLFCGSVPAMAGECTALIEQMENMGELKKILHCLDNKTTRSVRTEPQPFQHAQIKTKLTVERYLFEVEHCVRYGETLTCTVIITNKNKTVYSPDYREFGIYTPDSKFYDEFGNEHGATVAQMGKEVIEAQGPSNRKNFKDGYLEKYMPLGIPMKLTISFADIGQSATTVMALNIRFSHRKGKDLTSTVVTLEGIVIEDD